MIVFEERLRDLFNLLPEIQVNSNYSTKPFFGWGNKEELEAYIKLGKSKQYPLIWLLPDYDIYNSALDTTKRDVSLVIATIEPRSELMNPQRFKGSFKQVLNPLTKNIIDLFKRSNITNLEPLVKIYKEPNYSDNEASETIDKWDAVRIDCTLEINNFCLNESIKWQN